MNKICIKLENCYGIKSLECDFDFSKRKAYFIYASNGSMKTSFAKTFEDMSKKQSSQDRIHENKATIREIKDENNQPIQPNEVFVINSYDPDYKSQQIDTLLVNNSIKQEYILIFSDINNKKDAIIKALEKLSGLKKDVDKAMSKDIIFENDGEKFLDALLTLSYEVEKQQDLKFSSICYSKIFNDKTEALFKEDDFLTQLNNYIDIYNQLTKTSTFFKNGVCDHDNAGDISKNLIKNNFFKAEHSIFLSGEITAITTENELENRIKAEKSKILENKELSQAFDKIAKRLDKNEPCKEFRDYIKDKQFIIRELTNIEKFKRVLWISYLTHHQELYTDLITAYNHNKPKLDAILIRINEEQSNWQRVVDKFNKRFFVPFKLDIENRTDAVLGKKTPNIVFIFDDKLVEKDKMLGILSRGEQRALYLLNIIFEIEARKELNQKTLFIVDDIADSFDYQNKYAIIEYLQDISVEKNFYLIILSHNYDFYRTVSNRLESDRGAKLYAVRFDDIGIKLHEEKYQKNPFHHWKENIDKKENLIALIPFVRNLIEYCKGTDDEGYVKLTSLLHIKSDSDKLTISNLIDIIAKVINVPTLPNNSFEDTDGIMKSVIYDTADKIIKQQEETLELELKIVLSIAIRLRAEEFIINKIDSKFVETIKGNQTFMLIDEYKKTCDSHEHIRLFESVRLMTSENIHLNSFMYEPIIDMSSLRLKQLYTEVSSLMKH